MGGGVRGDRAKPPALENNKPNCVERWIAGQRAELPVPGAKASCSVVPCRKRVHNVEYAEAPVDEAELAVWLEAPPVSDQQFQGKGSVPPRVARGASYYDTASIGQAPQSLEKDTHCLVCRALCRLRARRAAVAASSNHYPCGFAPDHLDDLADDEAGHVYRSFSVTQIVEQGAAGVVVGVVVL